MGITTKDLIKFEEENRKNFKEIKESLNEFNIFNVLGVQRREIRHSNFLGWLFDPKGSHGLGDVFLKELLRIVSETGSLTPDKLKYKKLEQKRKELIRIKQEKIKQLLKQNLSNTIVHRETENNIDILIINKKLGFLICIENKIDADFSKHQLFKYYRNIKKHYSNLNHYFITLTPLISNNHKLRKKGGKYNNITYHNILDILSNNSDNIENKTTNTVKTSINQYKRLIEKYITHTSMEIQKAKEIYRKYKEEINFIIRYQENFSSYKDVILNEVRYRKLDGISVSHDSDFREVIFILPENEELRRIFSFEKAKSREGEYIFSIVIIFEKDIVKLKFGFGEIAESIDKKFIQGKKVEFYKAMEGFKIFDKEKIKDILDESYKVYLSTKQDPESDYPSIIEVHVLDGEILSNSGKDFTELFVERFNLINEKLIKPWMDECLSQLKH